MTKNGDAAYLPIGTAIYAVKDYKNRRTGSFRMARCMKQTEIRKRRRSAIYGILRGMVFYEKANAFTAGAHGTEVLRTVIVSERTRIKRAAGI